MKVGPLLGMTIAVALIVAPMVTQQPPLLVVWNASPSVPGPAQPPAEKSRTGMFVALGIGAVALTALTIFAASRSTRSA